MTKLTKHAEIRCNQRGIRLRDMELIMQSGENIGDYECLVSRKDRAQAIASYKMDIKNLEFERPEGWRKTIRNLKRKIQRFDKIAGKMLIMDGGQVITIYHGHSRKTKMRLRFSRRNGYIY